MIHFVVGATGSFSIRYYLAEEGAELADRMRVIEYDELTHMRSLPLGTWVFTETNTRTAPELELVALAWDRLRGEGADARLMNHPARAASRLELLDAAHDTGINRFRAVRAADVVFGGRRRSGADANRIMAPDGPREARLVSPRFGSEAQHRPPAHVADLRYPVFVRYANRHDGSLTPPLDSPRELERALGRLIAARNALDELLVVEFCDTRDGHGVYRKYAAFKVGDRILPRCLECSLDWMVKWEHRILDDERSMEESCYLATNPHEAWIRDVFRLANIDYGRIDYGVLDGQPQVWEINTNPTIGRPPGPRIHDPVLIAYKQSLSPGYQSFYDGFLAAWHDVDTDVDPGGEVELDVPAELLRAIEVARRRTEAEQRREARMRSLIGRPWMRPIVRGAKGALAVVAAVRVRRGW